MPKRCRPFRAAALLVLPFLYSPDLPAVEPGVDVAVPRVAISQVDSTLSFHPALLVVETGDFVRWMPLVASIHTTTSGANCLADGLWNASLGTPGVNFTRQFNETSRLLPYFCSPHCGFAMVGQVTVTTTIDVTVVDSSGTTKLSWTGGGGSYRVFRSDNPALAGSNTFVLSPDGGSTGSTFTDVSLPPPDVGKAAFYLVMNLF